jgi:hypothetical protein
MIVANVLESRMIRIPILFFALVTESEDWTPYRGGPSIWVRPRAWGSGTQPPLLQGKRGLLAFRP